MSYEWVKVLHIVAVISWMAGLLYLPRLFVYHADAKRGGDLAETLKTMERRLLFYIMNPAMIATYFSGFWLMKLDPELWSQPWLHAKLALVLGMTGVHGFLAHCRKKFSFDANPHKDRFYRVLNEIPTLLMIGIVILVVLKPF